MGVKENPVASGVMAGLWPLRFRSLHIDFCAGERVMGVKENSVASGVMARSLAIAPKVLTRRSLRRGARYGRKVVRRGLKRDGPVFSHCVLDPYTQTSALGSSFERKKLKKPKLQAAPVRHNPISFDDAHPTHALTSSRNQV